MGRTSQPRAHRSCSLTGIRRGGSIGSVNLNAPRPAQHLLKPYSNPFNRIKLAVAPFSQTVLLQSRSRITAPHGQSYTNTSAGLKSNPKSKYTFLFSGARSILECTPQPAWLRPLLALPSHEHAPGKICPRLAAREFACFSVACVGGSRTTSLHELCPDTCCIVGARCRQNSVCCDRHTSGRISVLSDLVHEVERVPDSVLLLSCDALILDVHYPPTLITPLPHSESHRCIPCLTTHVNVFRMLTGLFGVLGSVTQPM